MQALCTIRQITAVCAIPFGVNGLKWALAIAAAPFRGVLNFLNRKTVLVIVVIEAGSIAAIIAVLRTHGLSLR